MSTDWHVHCRTCNDTHTFGDANHQSKLMLTLIKHAVAIGNLNDLCRTEDIIFKVYYGYIAPEWFKTHCTHDLVALSEYGDIIEPSNPDVIIRKIR
jgi:hypothetical protein